MATRGKKPAPPPRKPAKPERKAKLAVAPAEEKAGMSFEVVISLVTLVILVAAVVTIDYANGKNYGSGWFFQSKYQAQ